MIDSHLHLDENVDGTADGAAFELNKQLQEAGIIRCIVLHLESQPWSVEEFSDAISLYPKLYGFINVHPYKNSSVQDLANGIDLNGFIGLKLHPRLQDFDLDDDRTVTLVNAAGEMNIPVLFDAFPDGTHLMQGFSPLKYATLARKCPATNIIWAHMGGHYVLDFMMLAKRLPNVYMDLSYSFLYYQNSPVIDNMIYAMGSMKYDRIFYGSDYPDRPIVASLNRTLEILREKAVSETDIMKIMSGNAINFFKWNDLYQS